MTDIADVITWLCALMGGGPQYDQAVGIIAAWWAAQQAPPLIPAVQEASK